jgi:chemotaxis protein methyltransferase CheR
MTLSESDLGLIRQFVLARAGIQLSAEKRYLVETRLAPVLRRFEISPAELARRLGSGDVALETAVVDAIATNETLFFRDKQPFDLFRTAVLPRLVEARRGLGRIRIWCAACSSGQEPYSLAMILDELRPTLGGIAFEILATDISAKILEQAREGVYSQFEVQRGLPIRLLLKHFRQEGMRWRIDKALAREIRFRPFNLLHSFAPLGRFDVIFCRNVLIYFNEPTKRDILGRMAEAMAPDGYLLLGGAESVLGLTNDLAPHRTERGLHVRAASPDALPVSFRPRISA